MAVMCQCGKPSVLVGGEVIYPHRPDLSHKRFYLCRQCRAWVGCHPGTSRPLGRLADAELRAAKAAAHLAIDPIWQSGEMTRGEAYKWLASQIGIHRRSCHIGEFSLEQCRRTLAALSRW
jgi:hypothetical protein